MLVSPNLQRPGSAADDRELTHKLRQAAFSDEEAGGGDEFGVVRPRGAPPLYGWLMREKFRRGTIGLQGALPGSTALVVCGGPGMDAEFLTRAGARVILSDVSLGAVLQAEERSRRFGLDLMLLVADVERLPFRDASVDLVYVHDGLHHLEEPRQGLAEMARVAHHAVSVNEPAKSAATNLGIRLGRAEEIEEAGNVVMRLDLDEVVEGLAVHGFRSIRPHRYAMLYRHWPGRLMRVLSLPGVRTVAVASFRLANRLFGRYGNKLAVQAVRSAPSTLERP